MITPEPPRSVDEFCREADALATQGERSRALRMVLDLVRFTIRSEYSIARVLSSRQLDMLCQRLGQTPIVVDSFDFDRTVYLVTFLSKSGGHSRVLRDLIRADPGTKPTVLVTNVENHADETELRSTFEPGIDLHVAPIGAPLDDVLAWTQKWLAFLRAERVYILQHHFDPVIPAAVQPSLVKKLFYIHNCDHSLALGVHLHHATHVDLHSKGFHLCRDREGVSNNVWWPLVSQPGPIRSFGPRSKPLRTATSGGQEKFDSRHLLEQVPYLLRYADMVTTILKATGGTHHHIGSLPKSALAEIYSSLHRAEVSPDRFFHVDFVPLISTYFIENEIDIYISSMPWGGGRALVEVMGAGLPVLLHSNYRSSLLTDQGEAYPSALTWRTFNELAARLTDLNFSTLERHAQASLAFYRARHQPEALERAIGATLRGESVAPPERSSYYPDALQHFLDERAASSGQVLMSLAALTERDSLTRDLERAYENAEKLAVERLEDLRTLRHAFENAEKLAVERLAELQALDNRLKLTDQALAEVTKTAWERLALIEALNAQLSRV